MGKHQLTGEMLAQLQSLPAAQQQRVLAYARALASGKPTGVPGKELLRFAGTIPPEDLRQMTQAIAEGCEQVDPHAW
jgi:hypothetical protein